jgi:ABC-type glutathione transport system ATPase component
VISGALIINCVIYRYTTLKKIKRSITNKNNFMIETQTRQITNHNLSQTKKMIRLKNIEKVYRTDTVETLALNSVTLDIAEGEFLSIMGPSVAARVRC